MEDHLNRVGLEFKRRLAAGELLLGGTLGIPHIMSAKMMARAGFDYVFIDLEHWPINIETLQALLDQFRATDALPIVRVPWNDAVWVRHVLDAGARGIVFPSINSPEEARTAVAHCRYPPLGTRGFGPIWATDFGLTRADYAATANAAIFVGVMIEHIQAAARSEAIAGVEGVDAVMVGPSDLSGSLDLLLPQVSGVGEIPQVRQVVDEVIAACRRARKPVFHAAGADAAAVLQAYERGVQAVNIGSDTNLIVGMARQTIAGVRTAASRLQGNH
jgi:2-keto-3-deoxy-L-rhamnonate aldolase RhmA